MTVRMTHPDLEGEIVVASSAVGIHANSGWLPVPGQDDMGEELPADAQLFDGQEQVRLHHPAIDGDPVIVVARSAVPEHRSRGWLLVEDAEEATSGAFIQEPSLEDLTAEELKELARDRGLPVSGTKAELVERLGAQQEPEPAESGEEE